MNQISLPCFHSSFHNASPRYLKSSRDLLYSFFISLTCPFDEKDVIFFSINLLDESLRPYKRICPSVGLSIRCSVLPSLCRSVGPSACFMSLPPKYRIFSCFWPRRDTRVLRGTLNTVLSEIRAVCDCMSVHPSVSQSISHIQRDIRFT